MGGGGGHHPVRIEKIVDWDVKPQNEQASKNLFKMETVEKIELKVHNRNLTDSATNRVLILFNVVIQINRHFALKTGRQ